MIIYEQAKKILIRSGGASSWFGHDFYMNMYRGCSHGCIYCDSRSECYHVDNFDTDIIVKENALELLRKELSSKRKKGVVGISGAMCDHYMPIEKKLELSKGALELILKFGFAVQIHTKSDLVLRDINLIEQINQKTNANVLFTITSASDKLSKMIEPNAPVSSRRFKAISELSARGIKTGIAIWPILPFITDTPENIRELIRLASEAGCDYALISYGMTLRGNQRDYYYDKLDAHGSKLSSVYRKVFGDKYDCCVKNKTELSKVFRASCKEFGLSPKVYYYQFPKIEQLSLFD